MFNSIVTKNARFASIREPDVSELSLSFRLINRLVFGCDHLLFSSLEEWVVAGGGNDQLDG